MKFDLFNLMQKRDEGWTAEAVFKDMTAQVRLAEQIGMETAWFAEHHFNNYSLCPSPLLAAAYCAGFTSKIMLGSAVLVLPLYNPMRVVQEIGMVDAMSGGRLKVGVGSGYQDYEFQRFGNVKLNEAVEVTMEILDIIELGLTRESFTYKGKHFDIPDTRIAIKPVQKPMPEIWVAGLMSHPKVQERVAKSGYVPFLTPSWNPVSVLKKVHDNYRGLYAGIGRDPDELPMGLMRFVHVTDDKAEARDAAERARYSSRVSLALRLDYAKIDGIYVQEMASQNEPPIEEMEKNYIIGDADTVIEKIVRDWETVRPSHIAVNCQLGGVPHDRVMRTLERMGSEVIPGVAKELAKRGAKPPVIRQQPLFAQAAE